MDSGIDFYWDQCLVQGRHCLLTDDTCREQGTEEKAMEQNVTLIHRDAVHEKVRVCQSPKMCPALMIAFDTTAGLVDWPAATIRATGLAITADYCIASVPSRSPYTINEVVEEWERGGREGEVPPGVRDAVPVREGEEKEYVVADAKYMLRPEVRICVFFSEGWSV